MPRGSGAHAQLRLTADLVILTIRDGDLQLLLIKRGNDPFRGIWALPGGFVSENEPVDRTALRELREETGIAGESLHLEQIRTYGEPGRDPRGRVVTVAYLGIAPDLPEPRAGTDATHAAWLPVDRVLRRKAKLAFDHHGIVVDAVERARSKLEYTSLATAFCTSPFTIADLRRVYEAVWGTTLDPGNFSRKVTKTDGFVIATGEHRVGETGRPPALYRRGAAVTLYPPMLRTSIETAGSNG
jgi:8-oxo-dGTP diphosphatase